MFIRNIIDLDAIHLGKYEAVQLNRTATSMAEENLASYFHIGAQKNLCACFPVIHGRK